MKYGLFAIVLFLLLNLGGWFTACSTEVPRITKEDLKSIMDQSDVIIIDVRYGNDWTGSDLKIKGAIREDPDGLKSWAKKYPKEKTLVFY